MLRIFSGGENAAMPEKHREASKQVRVAAQFSNFNEDVLASCCDWQSELKQRNYSPDKPSVQLWALS